MVSCMVARVGPHSDIAGLAKHSSVPVINALSDDFHPLQAIADFLTIHETFPSSESWSRDLDLRGLKVAWIGDSNNVLFDLASACIKMGVDISVASPEGYGIPAAMRGHMLSALQGLENPGKFEETTVPEDAIKGADILVTDTWVSMGQEEEAAERLKAFEGYQITNDLAKRGGAKPGWKFMHCLPRHQEEVHDEVFYSNRSLVFPEAQNRLWAAVGKYISNDPCCVAEANHVGQLCLRHSWSTRAASSKAVFKTRPSSPIGVCSWVLASKSELFNTWRDIFSEIKFHYCRL